MGAVRKVIPGTALPPWRVDPVEVGPMKVVAALLHDPNRIHWDVDNVRALGLGDRPVNQGPNNVGYIVNMLMAWADGPTSVRRVTVRFLGNVFARDVVEAGGVVTKITEIDGVRVARCDVWLDRDDGDRVVAGTAEVALPPATT